MTFRRGACAAFAATALLLAPACIVIPTPEHALLAGRGSISQEDLAFLAPGTTTREEVLLRFGEPDARLGEDRFFAYRWAVAHGYYLVGGYTVGYAGPIGKNYLLFVAFDDAGVLQRWRMADAMVRDPTRLFELWVEGKPLPDDAPPPGGAPPGASAGGGPAP